MVIFYFHHSVYIFLAFFFKKLPFSPFPSLFMIHRFFYYSMYRKPYQHCAFWCSKCPKFGLYYWISKILHVKSRKKTKCNWQIMGCPVRQLFRKLPFTNSVAISKLNPWSFYSFNYKIILLIITSQGRNQVCLLYFCISNIWVIQETLNKCLLTM